MLSYNNYKPTEMWKKNINRYFVDNYFIDCPCCKGEEKILKTDAKSFKRLEDYTSFGWGYSGNYDVRQHRVAYYTTKEGYKNHLTIIKEWEREKINAYKAN